MSTEGMRKATAMALSTKRLNWLLEAEIQAWIEWARQHGNDEACTAFGFRAAR